MRVVCDNCGASYKIPETKLVKEVNKATCRKCGHRMLIRKAGDGDGATQQMDENPYLSSAGSEEFRSAIAAAAAGVPRVDIAPRSEWEEEDPTHIAQLDDHGEPIPPPPPPVPKRGAASAPAASAPAAPRPQPAPALAAPVPAPVSVPRPAAPVAPPPVAIHSPGPAAYSVPVPPPVTHSASPAPSTAAAFDPSGDLGVIGFGVIIAAIGGLLLAVADGGFFIRFAALFLALWGTLTSLFVVVTGSRGRRKASVVLSTVLGTLFAVVGSGAVIGAKSGADALSAFSGDLGERAVAELAEPPPAAPLGTLFAEEATPQPEAAPEPLAEAEPAAVQPPPAEPAPAAVPAPAPVTATEPKAKEPSVERESAYVAPPSEPARSSTGTSSSTSSARTSSSTSSSKGSTASSTASEPAPAASSGTAKSAMSSLPPTVVATMVKSNQSVKKCMYQEFKRSDGNLGSVTVRFKVLASGKVSSASVLSSRYKGTELDTCMTAALYTVTFPSFDGDAESFDITLGT